MRPGARCALDRRRELHYSSSLPSQLRFRHEKQGRGPHAMLYSLDPEARLLWCLRRRTTAVRCVLYATARPVEILVLQEQEVVLRERFAALANALEWAREYAARLKQHGWSDCPDNCSPSSAA